MLLPLVYESRLVLILIYNGNNLLADWRVFLMSFNKMPFTIFICASILVGCNYSGVEVQGLSAQDGSNSDTPVVIAPTYATLSDQLYLGIEGNACGIDSTAQLKCWGANHDSSDAVYGLLGTGDSTGSSLSTFQDVNETTSYSAISVGEFTVCAITNTGTVQCWGHRMAAGDTNYAGGDITTPRDIDDFEIYSTIASVHTIIVELQLLIT
jgi:hypothetical protein